MKAVLCNRFGSNDVLEISDVPIPSPQADEVLIKVHAAGVNPVDWKIREGLLKTRLPHEFPIILGWDVSGVVEEAGAHATRFSPGDEVYAYCRRSFIKWGSYAEYTCVEESSLALKPKTLSFAESASIPLVTLTAWQALVDFAHIEKGMSVLIHAGAGGVGSMGIQIAKMKGATVYTTASASHHDYVRKLGADYPIDYTKQDFVLEIRKHSPEGVDIVFDCIGGTALEKSVDIVKKGGALVTIVDFQVEHYTRGKELKSCAIFVEPNAKELELFAKYLDEGILKIPALELFPLKDAANALERIQEGHTQGKIVLTI